MIKTSFIHLFEKTAFISNQIVYQNLVPYLK